MKDTELVQPLKIRNFYSFSSSEKLSSRARRTCSRGSAFKLSYERVSNSLKREFEVFDCFSCPCLFTVPRRAQDLQPRIHLTEADFKVMTRKGAHCSAKGRMSPVQFEAAIREQVRLRPRRAGPPAGWPAAARSLAARCPAWPMEYRNAELGCPN